MHLGKCSGVHVCVCVCGNTSSSHEEGAAVQSAKKEGVAFKELNEVHSD